MINNLELYNKSIKYVLEKNKFPELKNKTILITGINGMIASAIIDTLNYLNKYENYNIKIIGIVRNKQRILSRFKDYDNLEIIEHDIINPLLIHENIDYIINAASNSHPSVFASDPVGTLLTNFIGTKNLLDCAKYNDSRRLLYISSGEIYGEGSKNITSFKEDYRGFIDSTNPRSCYPIGKLSAESLCVSYSDEYGVDTVIARPCHIYGPTAKNDDSRALSQFIFNGLNHTDIIMKSRGEQVRSYCYVLDCVTGILRILISGVSSNAYNIANNKSIISIKETADIIAKLSNTEVKIVLANKNEKKGFNPVTRSVLDGKKLKSIGWVPRYDFSKGIETTLNIMK